MSDSEEGGGGLGGDCPVPEEFFFVGKSSRFHDQTLGNNAMLKLSSVKYAIPGSPRYQQNRLNLLYSCSLHNNQVIFFRYFLGERRQAGSKRGEPDTCDGGRRSSLASPLPSVAWKTRKNNARYAGYHSWVKIKGAIYEEKTILAHRPKGKVFSVKTNKTCFERNEESVCG